MNSLATVRPVWALLVLVLLWAAPSQAALHFGDIVISNIAHTFQPATTNGEAAVIKDWLIDQGQLSGATGRLLPLTTNLTSENTFTLKVSAPAGMKFWIRPPSNGYVQFQGGLIWQFNLPTEGNTIYGGTEEIGFENLVGIPAPARVYSRSFHDPTTSRVGFGVVASAMTEFTFTSFNFTGKVSYLLIAGPGPVTFLPTPESKLRVDSYSSTDIGPLISLVPLDQPVNAMVALSEALDTEGTPFVWTTIGDYSLLLPWNGRLFGSRGGTDVAESGLVTNGSAVTLQGKAVGPGTLSWWWKVSSETNKDYLKVFVDGVQQARISGEVAWQERSLHLDHGLHVLKWTYAKDSSGAAGADKGWVDEVRFVPDTNCQFNLNPAGRVHAAAPATGTLEVATSADCLWSVICTNSWIVALTPVLNRGSGTVTYAVRNNPGIMPRTGVLSVAGQSFVVTQSGGPNFETEHSLEEALDLQGGVYISYNSFGLLPQILITHDRVDAAQFGPVPHEDNNTSQHTVSLHTKLRGPGTLSFWWKVSCETNLDMMKFFGPNGEERITGETDWQYRSYRIPDTWYEQEVYWAYSKDESYSVGNDRGWLDQLHFVPDIQGSVAISPSNRMHGFGAEFGFIDVTANSGIWRAWTTSDWMSVSEEITNINGRVEYHVFANPAAQERTGHVYIADQTFTVLQAGNPAAPRPDPPLNLRILSYTPTGGITLQIQGPRLETNIVQVSSNLVHWTPISTNTMPDTVCPTCPSVQIFDPTATNAVRRFYRAVQK